MFERIEFFGLTRRRVAAFVGVTVAAAFFEGFGMAMFLPVLEYIEKGQNLDVLRGKSQMWDRLIETFALVDVPLTLASLLAVAIVLMLLRVVFIYLR